MGQSNPERSASPRWIVREFDFGAGDADGSTSVLVCANSEPDAAAIGAEYLQTITDAREPGEIVRHVFVVEWTGRACYGITGRRFTVERSEWQCCGGPNEDGGHYGACPAERCSS